MRVVYLWDADYPWDVRAEKSCLALTRAGHEVHLAARNRAWRPLAERLPEATVHRMPPWRALGRRVDGLLSFPAFFSPRWTAHLARVARLSRADVVVARDLPLCPTALFVARRAGIPVVLDLAENYPAMLRQTRDAGRARPWDALARSPALAAAVERACLPRVDHVLAVVEESAARVEAMGVAPERVSVVSNTPPRARALRRPGRAETDAGGPLRLVYLGLMEAPRGVGDLLDAAALLRAGGVDARVRLVGGGRDLQLFRARALRLGLGPAVVEMTGSLPHAEALAALEEADVGVVPHHADEAWCTTIPNKLFDYMAAGLPVLSSHAAPAARVLRETGAGLVFRSGDARALADAVARLRDPALRARLGAAGRRAVLGRYNWENDSAVLVRAVEGVVEAAAGRGAPAPPSAKTAPPAAPTARKAAK